MAIVFRDWPSAYKLCGWPNLGNIQGPQSLRPLKDGAQDIWEGMTLSLRLRTKIAQKLPAALDEKIFNFQRFIIKNRKITDFHLARIGNMDETPMCFDMPHSSTLHKKGEKTVLLRTTGHDKDHFTVVLACTADGGKLPPMVIFRRKTFPKDKFTSGVVIHNHVKGWMDEKRSDEMAGQSLEPKRWRIAQKTFNACLGHVQGSPD